MASKITRTITTYTLQYKAIKEIDGKPEIYVHTIQTTEAENIKDTCQQYQNMYFEHDAIVYFAQQIDVKTCLYSMPIDKFIQYADIVEKETI